MAPNGSNVAPANEGNTDQISLAADNPKNNKSPQRPSAKVNFLVTVPATAGSDGSIHSWIQTHCKRAVWQLEKGTESGYEHYQISLTLKNKQRITWFKHHFEATAHVEPMFAPDQAFDYSCKTDTRIRGPWKHPPPIQSVRDPLEGKILHEWQQQVVDITNTEPDDRTIHWFWEETGNKGKSALAKHLVLTKDALVVSGKKNDIYHALGPNCKILILDIPRTVEDRVPYEAIECIKNGLIFSGKYESKMKAFNPPHVICFANFPPDKRQLSEDRWHIVNI